MGDAPAQPSGDDKEIIEKEERELVGRWNQCREFGMPPHPKMHVFDGSDNPHIYGFYYVTIQEEGSDRMTGPHMRVQCARDLFTAHLARWRGDSRAFTVEQYIAALVTRRTKGRS